MMRRRNAQAKQLQEGVNMDDDLLLKMEGRWYLIYSGCPLWLKDDINTISFNYIVRHVGEELVLEDRVEYIKNGKMRFRLGYDYPVEGIQNTFRWKGRGVNRTFRNHFEVVILEAEYMVLFFEKTLTSPTSIDILTRQRHIPQPLEEEIFQAVRDNPTVSEYFKDIRRVKQVQGNVTAPGAPSP